MVEDAAIKEGFAHLRPAAAYDNGSSSVWTQCYAYLMNTSIGSEGGVPEPDLAETAGFTGDS